jgi:murein L,D-transpeptidase YcbB/YkuD
VSHSQGYYISINVPDFHAEVWDGGQRLKRFKVIVGSTRGYKDAKTGQWRYPNATPRFSDVMETIVFNPFWNVPPRIRRELQRKAEADPDYYERNNYEVLYTNNGHEMLRQKPGPGNALGQVKFLFPNEHDIYLHDTPRKDLFNNPVRAYSHGCMRVHEPLELAAFLLKREDESWTPGRARAIVRSGKQFRYSLRQGPEVHIEYRTVRADQEGRVHFLADIYEEDARYIAKTYNLKSITQR